MLIDILNEIAASVGYNLSDAGEKNMLIYRVNQAARRLHFGFEIKEATDEFIADFDQESQQIALPEFVHFVRGMRWHGSYERVDLDDIANRYNYNYCNELWPLKYRRVRSSPFCRNIENESILKLSIPLAATEQFKVTIGGATEHSSRDSETITFNPGDLEKETTLNFKEPIYSVTKDKVTKYDITIKDVEDNVVCVFPNYATSVRYKIFQITDSDTRADTGNAIEVLYTEKFKNAKEDTDTFWGTDDYDFSIIRKFMQLYGSDEATIALAHKFESESSVTEIQTAEQQGVEATLSFKPVPYYNMPYDRTSGRRTRFN